MTNDEKTTTDPKQARLAALQHARDRAAEVRAAGGTVAPSDPIARAKANPHSLRRAVTGKCWDCVGAGCDPNPRKAIRECTSEATCTLWPVRPYQRKDEEGAE